MIGVLCLALLDARGCPCVAAASVRARRLVVRRRDSRESNVSLIQLSYMAPRLTKFLLRHSIFSCLSLSAVPKSWSKDVSLTRGTALHLLIAISPYSSHAHPLQVKTASRLAHSPSSLTSLRAPCFGPMRR